jgi:hypothetical protein
MMKRHFAAMLLGCVLAGGCVQMPTERQGTADMRPQVALRFDPQDAAAASARVQLDGNDIGSAQDYAEGTRALRISPGSHDLRVVNGTRLFLDERFYLGDGVNRTFLLR